MNKVPACFGWCLSAIVLLFHPACSDSTQLALLDSRPAESQPNDDPELLRLEQLQLIRLLDTQGKEHTTYVVDPTDGFNGLVVGLASAYCNFGGELWLDCSSTGVSDCFSTQTKIGSDRWAICTARALQMAASLRTNIQLPNYWDSRTRNWVEGPVTLPPQSAEARVALLRWAYAFLDDPRSPMSTSSWGSVALPLTGNAAAMIGDFIAQTDVDRYNAIEEISNDLVEAMLGVSDAQRGGSPTPQVSIARSMAGAQLSRAEAAHFLVGGDPGILGSTTQGFCSSTELSGRGRRALALLRKAALAPAAVKAENLSIDTLLNGDLATLPSGSVRVRLSALDGVTEDYIGTVQRYSGLDAAEFVEARSYLAEELNAFGRSNITFTPKLRGTAPSIEWFAGVRTEPQAPPPEYYGALAKYSKGSPQTATLPQLTNLSSVRSGLLGELALNAGISAPTTGPLQQARWAQMTSPYAMVLSTAPRRGRLSFTSTGTFPALNVTYTLSGGYQPGVLIVKGLSAYLCAVKGALDGQPCQRSDFTNDSVSLTTKLSAGIRGTSNATNVVANDLIPRFIIRPRAAGQTQPGQYEYLGSFMWTPSATYTPAFVDLAPDLDRKAGELLAPSPDGCARPQLECDGKRLDERLPLENELADDGDDIESSWRYYLNLARQAATEADELGEAYILAGLDRDRAQETQELRDIDDQQRFISRAESELETVQNICGTAIDNSVLMNLVGIDGARVAAAPSCSVTAADTATVAQEKVRTECCGGLTKPCPFDCNTSTKLCKSKSCTAATDCCQGVTPCPYTCTSNVCAGPPAACSENADCCNGSPDNCLFECIEQACVRTPLKLLSAQFVGPQSHLEAKTRIEECLGQGAVLDYVAPGNTPFCVWEDNDNANRVCADSTESKPCPAAATWVAPPLGGASSYDCSGMAVPANKRVRLVRFCDPGQSGCSTDLLGIFDSTALSPIVDPCDAVRRLRGPDEASTSAIRDKLVPLLGASNAYRWQTVSEIAKGIGWYADAATPNVSYILLNGFRMFSTGSQGPQPTSWPCKAHPQASPSTDGLFSRSINCNGPTSEADLTALFRMNQRMFGATTALVAMTSGDFAAKILPFAHVPSTVFPALGGSTHVGTQDNGTLWVKTFDSPTIGYTHQLMDDPNDSTPAPAFLWKFYPVSGAAQPMPAAGNLLVRRGMPNIEPPRDRTQTAFFAALEALKKTTVPPTDLDVAPCCAAGNSPTSQNAAQAKFSYPMLVPLEGWTIAPVDLHSPFQPNIWDALELVCEAGRRTQRWTYTPTDTSCPDLDVATLTKPADFRKVKDFAACRIRSFERAMGGATFARMPVQAVKAIKEFRQVGSFPAIGGTMGTEVLSLADALIQFSKHADAMKEQAAILMDVVDRTQNHIERLQIRSKEDALALANAKFKSLEAQIRLDKIDFETTAVWTRMGANCAAAIAHGASGLVSSFGTSSLAAAADCLAASINASLEEESLGYERRIAEVEKRIINNEIDAAQLNAQATTLDAALGLLDDRAQLRSSLHQMGTLAKEARGFLSQIDGALSRIEGLKLTAQRALTRATQFRTTQAATTEAIDSVLNARLNTARERYREARRSAVVLTSLAKRAIEQRLGLRLSELRTDLPLVAAPSTWESRICNASGIDYEKLNGTSTGGKLASPNFADSYIGSFVDKLENLVESYRLVNSFQNGSDEVVASVRDDILNVRAPCNAPSGNLLGQAGILDGLTRDYKTSPGWQFGGCALPVQADCLQVSLLAGTPAVFTPASGTISSPGYELKFGAAAGAATSLQQYVDLPPGSYRLSWYATEDTAATPQRTVDAELINPNGSTIGLVSATSVRRVAAPDSSTWPRFFAFYDLPSAGTYVVSLKKGPSTASGAARSVGAVMLERIGEPDISTDVELSPDGADKLLTPPPFVGTYGDTAAVRSVCEDTDGAVFRESAWRRECSRLCPDGFSDRCLLSGPEYCFWETVIPIDQRDIESGRIFKQSGFARGNFNYRIESIAVNFVGSGTRDCTTSGLPSSCFAAGYLPYSLTHIGPLNVRNHLGQDFPAKVHTAHVEHARGLALERYLTNPLSSTDRELLSPFVRPELRGRPLDGNIVLRVWDDPGVNFSGVADVQLYIKYRYWTRFD